MADDPFGKLLLGAGLSEATIKAWSVDPRVPMPDGKTGSLFDALEDMNLADCVALWPQARDLALQSSRFCHAGRAVCAIGSGSNRLSLFDVASGERVWEATRKDADGRVRAPPAKGAQVSAFSLAASGGAAVSSSSPEDAEVLLVADGKFVDVHVAAP